MTAKRVKHPAGLLGEHVSIELDGDPGDFEAVKRLLESLAPASRIERLRVHPELVERANELSAWLRENGGRANPALLAAIAGAEAAAILLKAAPSVIRDNKRQAGTRKPKRPEVQKWIDDAVARDPAATAKELWGKRPGWLDDQIGFDRFQKRVTAARKTRRK